MRGKLVSVVIPTYMRPLTLTRAIDSVLNQTYSNLEVIIVDDNNPNTPERIETEEVMLKYKENSRVIYIKHEKNKNGSVARNTGAKYSKGEYIMFLDDDDEFLPNKVLSQVNCLESKGPEWGVCYTKYKRLRKGKIDTICYENREGNLYFEELCRNLFIQAGSNLMVRRSAFEDIGGFDESFKRNQDIEFAVRLLKKYKIAYVDEMGLIYHRHPNPGERNFDMDKITKHYLKTFKPFIEEFSKEEKRKFYKIINLQLFRYRILSKKDFLGAIKVVKKNDLSGVDIIRYFIHLGYRKVSKKSYGFKI